MVPFLIGMLGILLSTVLPQILLFPFGGVFGSKRGRRANYTPASLRAIVFFCGPNEHLLRETVSSVLREGECALLASRLERFRIEVWCDGFESRRVAEQAGLPPQVHVCGVPEPLGKWQLMLHAVEARGGYSWVGFIDEGIVWPEGMIEGILPDLLNPEVIGVGPRYRQRRAQFSKRVFWWIEQICKYFENPLGGPVSLHGASVLYRSDPLERALAHLSCKRSVWTNDDVVIPMTLRAMNPGSSISYRPDLSVLDLDHDHAGPIAVRRRARLMRGNIEWVRYLLVDIFRHSSFIGVLACRRVFRSLWPVWLACLGFGSLVMIFPALESGDQLLVLFFTCFALILFRWPLLEFMYSGYELFRSLFFGSRSVEVWK